MGISFEYLGEPKLQFAEFFEHEDTKTGLAEYGPFGRNVSGLHPSEIRLGFIGTRETISGAQEWVTRCGSFIESENIKLVGKRPATKGEMLFAEGLEQDSTLRRLNKILNRDFVGFSKDSPFQCCFQMNPRWERAITPREITQALETPDKAERILRIVGLISERLASIVETDPVPDIVIVALTPEIEAQADTVRVSGSYYLDLRRAIKAQAMQMESPVPVQLLRRSTIMGRGDLQEVATRAWNFCTALYYKAEGTPWRPITLERDTCYVGVSFYVAQEVDSSLTMRSSVAQAYDYLGQGLVLRGDEFSWDSDDMGRTPHLTREAAGRLMAQVLAEYVKLRNAPPSRVVIHKSSEFWGDQHGDYDEVRGFYEGIDQVNSRCETDFVSIRQTGLRLFREGNYPPLRGTHFCVDNTEHFLYTMGFIPYLETYPKTYVPEPWQMVQHIGGSAPKELFREILALTKMNVNNCAFADGTPITLKFSKYVGEVMKHVPADGKIQSKYRFYM